MSKCSNTAKRSLRARKRLLLGTILCVLERPDLDVGAHLAQSEPTYARLDNGRYNQTFSPHFIFASSRDSSPDNLFIDIILGFPNC